MAKREYFDIKEQFDILKRLAKRIDVVHEIRETYPQIDDMRLKDVENFLCERYGKIDNELAKQLNLD